MAGEIPMSVKRMIALADVSTLNVSGFCAEHGLGRTQFYEVRKRFAAEGEAGLEPRSRAPKTVANKTPVMVEEQIVRLRKQLDEDGLDAGAETIRWHLLRSSNEVVPSVSTIWRILKQRGFVVDDPSKRPSNVWKRFAAERANELFQIDGTDHLLATGEWAKIINIIDDGSRYCPASQAHPSESYDAVWATVCAGFADVGMPARFLSDNGKAFLKLQATLATLGITMGHSSLYHPQTCGKVERFHQTQAKWLAARPQADNLAELQTLLNAFREIYNHQRPHRGIGRTTPADQWNAMAKSGPADRPLNLEVPTTTHHTKVAANGAVAANSYRISIGAKHAGQMAWTIITGTRADIFINSQHTRTLTLDPTRRVQPLYDRKGHPGKGNL
jgi:transposase InsO family protein